MNITKLIKHKFIIKYITLFVLLSLFIPLIGILITEFILTQYSTYCLIAFIIIFLLAIFLMTIYEKKYSLPKIESLQTIDDYLSYFSSAQISDLEYSESITWFSHLMRSAYLKKHEKTDDYVTLVNTLYRILRSEKDSNLCIALNHKNSFIKLAKDLLENNNIQVLEKHIEKIIYEEPETYKYLHITLDKGILWYIAVFPTHLLACIFLAGFGGESFHWNVLLGNILLCLPTDVIAILVYKGVIKSTQE